MLIRHAFLSCLLPAVLLVPQERGGRPAAPAGDADAHAELIALYFTTADWDGDGWLRFTEAEKSMDLDRSGFAVYDQDRDGRITREEFTARYRGIVSRGGVFPAPRARPDAEKPRKRTSAELLAAHDIDLDGALSESEVARAQQEARLGDPEASVLVASLDSDRSGGLDGPELDALVHVLYPEARKPAAARAKSLEELFDQVESAPRRVGATISPPRIVGPVPVFRRLDVDRSAGISLQDLRELARPLVSEVRPPVVLATLDADGDGVISPEELRASMRTGSPLVPEPR